MNMEKLSRKQLEVVKQIVEKTGKVNLTRKELQEANFVIQGNVFPPAFIVKNDVTKPDVSLGLPKGTYTLQRFLDYAEKNPLPVTEEEPVAVKPPKVKKTKAEVVKETHSSEEVPNENDLDKVFQS